MVTDHPDFCPPAPDVPLWRYLDFTKFVFMLESRALFLTRADRFVDRFEGSFTLRNVGERPDWSNRIAPDALKAHTAMSCWHMNEYESAAMWELYLKSDEGVAIRSDYGRLCDALEDAPEEVHVGLVHYIDYDRDRIPADSTFFPFLHKRRSFAHEREVRALVQRLPGDDGGPTLPGDGLEVGIDLDRLIERVYVAPYASPWFERLVAAVARRYGLGVEIVRSDLRRDPVF